MREERWDFYFCELAGRVATVALDLSWGDPEHLPARAWRDVLALVQVAFSTDRADGLPDPDAGARLAHVEDVAIEGLARRDVLLVGRITTAGRRDHFFFARSDEDLAATLTAAFTAGGQAPARVAVRRDPDWALYTEVLAPGPQEHRWMRDRREVERLRAAGEDLSRPRPVEHRFRLAQPGAVDELSGELGALGFEVRGSAETGEVRAIRTDAVDLDALHELGLDLDARARALGGVYEGWSAGRVLG